MTKKRDLILIDFKIEVMIFVLTADLMNNKLLIHHNIKKKIFQRYL